MIIELQIDSATLIASFRERMRQELACQLFEFPFLNAQWRVTSYELGPTKLRRSQSADGNACVHVGAPNVVTNLPIRTVQLVQTLTVNTCRTDELITANGALGPIVPLTMDIIFTVETDTCGSMRQLCFRYTDIDPDLPEVKQAIGTRIPTACTGLPIDRVLAEVLPAGLPLINAHLTLGTRGESVVVRMEFWQPSWQAETGDPPRALPYWTRFYAGVVSDHLLPGEQWSVFVDHHVLVHQVRTLIRNSFAGSTKTRLHSGPFGAWINHGGVGRIRVWFNADSINACRCFTKEIDVNADVTLDVDTTVPAPNSLRQDIWVDVSPDFWDSACCVATAALFWPVVGAEQFAKQNINQGQYLLCFLPFAALGGALAQVLDASSALDPPTGFTKDDEDGAHLFRTQPINLGSNPTLGVMTLTTARAVDDEQITGARGLLTAGTLTIATRRLPVLADIGARALEWGSGGRCSRTLSANALFHLDAVTAGDQALLALCGFEVVDDPLGVFRRTVTYERDSGNRHWLTIKVPIGGFTQAYWANPYPCRIVVRTNGGIRIVSVAPPPRLTAQQAADLGQEIQLRYVNECYLPKYRVFEELEWAINPILREPGIYLWQISVRGLPAGERLRIVDAQGDALGTVTVTAEREALLTAVAPLAESGAPLTVLREGHDQRRLAMFSGSSPIRVRSSGGDEEQALEHTAGGHAAGALARHRYGEVIVRQTRLLHASVIPLRGELLQLTSRWATGRPVVLAVTAGLIEAFDVTHPAQPTTERSIGGLGIRGVATFGGDLFAWGEDGIRPLWQPRADASPEFGPCVREAVHGAAAAGGRLWLLRDGMLHAYNEAGCEVAGVEAPDARGLVSAGDVLVVADAEGFRVLDSREPAPAFRWISYPPGDMGRVAPVPALAPHPLLTVTRNDHIALVRVRLDAVEEVARYARTPWFTDAVRIGRVLAFPTPDRRSVVLTEAVATALD